MRSRSLFVAGLALFWPFLQGPYFSTFFGSGSAAEPSTLPFVFNGWVLVTSFLIGLVVLRPGRRPCGGRVLVTCGLLSTALLGLSSLGLGGEALRWVAAPVAALAFGALACAWALLARRRCACVGGAAVFFEIALSYVCCYGLVFGIGALLVALQAPLWALCPALSAALWAVQGGDCGIVPLGGEERLPAPMGSRPVLPLAVACVALGSSVLAGLYSGVPAQSYGPSALCALALVGCAALAGRRTAWGAAAWGLALIPVLMSGFLVMAFSPGLTVLGIDALTLGRRLLWVLYWWLLVADGRGLSLRVVAWGFAPVYAATRLIIDGLRVGASELAADPVFASGVTVAVVLVLEVASLAVVGLVVADQVQAASQRGDAASSPATPVQAVDVRAAACNSIAQESGLTERERDVLELVSMGYTVQRIAEERGVSQNTVRTHTKGLYRKLDIHSKQEVIELVNARMG